MMKASLLGAAALLAVATQASADIITVTVTGIVSPVIQGGSFATTYGIDYGGYFGPAGASLAGSPFTVVWTGIDCNCSGTASFNPIIDAVLTINGRSYDFGSGSAFPAYNDFFSNFQQVEPHPGNVSLSTNDIPGLPGSRDGAFYIQPTFCSCDDTQAFLTVSAVPGPVVGAGLPGAIAGFLGLLGWWRRRR